MANLFENFKQKVNTFVGEETITPATKQPIQPRNAKSVTVGNSTEEESSVETQTRIFDTSDDVCVIRGIQLLEDSGNYMDTVIKRLEQGQLIVVDFSESNQCKDIQFYALWGASRALHGSFKILDKAGNLVLFTSNENKIGEDRHPSSAIQ